MNNSSYNTIEVEETYEDDWTWDDAAWILCNSFIIFTMQTGNFWRLLLIDVDTYIQVLGD